MKKNFVFVNPFNGKEYTYSSKQQAIENPLYIKQVNLSGNRKLKNSNECMFFIWSLPAVKTCPGSCESCRKSCYALKAQRLYPQVLPCRERSLQVSKLENFVERMCYTIALNLATEKYASAKKIVFRIHQSGDFYNREYMEKWLKVACAFHFEKKLVFTAYTKSYWIFDGVALPDNFALLASIWCDSSVGMIETTERNKWNIYTACTEEELSEKIASGENLYKCECKDCGACQACYNKQYKNIYCIIH